MDAIAEQVVITDAAADQIRDIIAAEGPNFQGRLRIFVQGGGCSGFQYGFAFDTEVSEDDHVFEKNGIEILVDAMSLQYLLGSTIDYKKSLSGSNFSISNPNAKSHCGCGSSFAA